MAAENNLTGADQLKKVRELDFVQQFTHANLDKLIEVLGVTRQIPMVEGTTLYIYETTGTLESGVVAEGEVIPLSKMEQTKTAVGEITLNKWRKAVSAEAISKSGYDVAVAETDVALQRLIQKGIRTNLFSFLNGTINGSTSAEGKTLQETLANAWGQLQVKFEDDDAEPVFFINPLDVAEYLGTATITTQDAFGMNYIEGFLGLGTAILTSGVTKGNVIATAKQNLIMYYMNIGGETARAFELTADQLGLVGIASGIKNTERAQIESLAMSGIQFLPEYGAGVIKGTISGGRIASLSTADTGSHVADMAAPASAGTSPEASIAAIDEADLEVMTKSQLLEYAAGMGIDGLKSSMTKASIIDAIRGADA